MKTWEAHKADLCTPDLLHAHLKRTRRRWTIEALADTFNVAPRVIRANLEQLDDRSVLLHVAADNTIALTSELPPRAPTIINTKADRWTVIGATADNHLASRYSRLDVIEALFDIWESQGVKDVYVGGNMIDGEAKFNVHDLIVHGFEGQANYFAEHWPQRKGITSHLITGDDHEGWYVQREQIDVGKRMEQTCRVAGRTDVVYEGHMEHDFELRTPNGEPRIMRVIHAGGGTAYALSYTTQSIINSYTGGEKPHVLLVGHYHKAEYNYWREVHAVQLATTETQTPFMRKKKIQAHIGGWTIRILQDDDGSILRFVPEFHPFYDTDFYEKRWKYQWRQHEKGAGQAEHVSDHHARRRGRSKVR